jgi:cytochrome P450
MIPPKVTVTGPSFYELYRAIAEDKTLTAKQRAAAEVGLLEQWISNPRGMCTSLLDHPDYAILQTPLATFVTKFREVSEVLEHDDVFGVAAGYGERMAISSGAFMLGMDAGATYERETSLIRLAMPATDVPELRAWLRSYAEGIVGQIAKAGTRIDVAEDIGYRVPAGFCGHYYGVPGPDEDVWTAWQQMLAMYIFNFWTGNTPFKEEASAVGLRYQSYINDTIRQRWAAVAAGQDVPDDVLTRMITRAITDPAGSLDEAAIRRNLGGLSIGSTIAPSNNIIFALDTIIGLKDSDPGTFATILRAITDNDGQLLERCVLEACRIGNPVPPTLFRIAKQDYVVAAGTPRAKTIAVGTTVVLVPTAAVMDAETIDDPARFRIDRPDWNYLIFGDGMHQCSGRAIGTIMLTEAVRAVLKLPNVRRAAGAASHVQFGSGLPGMGYPAHLMFDFDSA